VKDIAKQKIGKPHIEVSEGPCPARERVTHYNPTWFFGKGNGTSKPETERKIIDRGK